MQAAKVGHFSDKKNSNNAKVAKESKHFLISSVRNHQKKTQ